MKPPAKKKCDPVTLYHYYTSLWNKYKSNVPGENDWSDLRWNIRQKMAGNVPKQLTSKVRLYHIQFEKEKEINYYQLANPSWLCMSGKFFYFLACIVYINLWVRNLIYGQNSFEICMLYKKAYRASEQLCLIHILIYLYIDYYKDSQYCVARYLNLPNLVTELLFKV